jgi:cobalt/nickel transport system permease protein
VASGVRGRGIRLWALVTIGVIAAIVVAASLWASADPDGLERIAADLGFLDRSQAPGYQLLPDYTLPGLDGTLSTIVAGLIGVAIVGLVVLGIGRLLSRRQA